MINARTAAAMALVLGALALALGVGAILVALRNDEAARGRLVETHLQPFEGDPVLFYLDDFYLSAGGDGRLRALYLYPPSHFGQMRGCKVVWVASEVVVTGGRRHGPGLFVDPCGGARFDRQGDVVQGPAERALDYFGTQPGFEGIIVDTRTLYCGSQADVTATGTAASPTPAARGTAPSGTVTPHASSDASSGGVAGAETCDRVSPDSSE